LSAATDARTTEAGGVHPLATTFAYYGAFIGLGLISASLGPTLPALAEQTQTALSAISFLFATRALGYLIGSLLAGRLYDRMTGHPVMAVALVVMGIGMAVAPFFSLLWALALVLLIIGVGEGTLDVGGNALLVWVHRSRVGPYMNALHLFFGVGTFLSPLIVAQSLQLTEGIRWAYWLLAFFTLPLAIWLLRLGSPRSVEAQVEPQGAGDPVKKVQRTPINWKLTGLAMLFMCVYVGAEVGIGGWLYTYAIEMELANATSAAYLTSVYWGAFMVGRIFSIPIAARVRPRVILWMDLIGCFLSVALLVLLPHSQWALWVGAFGFGLFVASIFPTVITWAERRMNMSGQVTSLFLVGSSIGAIFFPWFIGQLFDRYGPWITMPSILVFVVVLMVVFVLLMANGGTPKSETSVIETP
jgi:FHS family Na+ dependent glucose MFS transporter 1